MSKRPEQSTEMEITWQVFLVLFLDFAHDLARYFHNPLRSAKQSSQFPKFDEWLSTDLGQTNESLQRYRDGDKAVLVELMKKIYSSPMFKKPEEKSRHLTGRHLIEYRFLLAFFKGVSSGTDVSNVVETINRLMDCNILVSLEAEPMFSKTRKKLRNLLSQEACQLIFGKQGGDCVVRFKDEPARKVTAPVVETRAVTKKKNSPAIRPIPEEPNTEPEGSASPPNIPRDKLVISYYQSQEEMEIDPGVSYVVNKYLAAKWTDVAVADVQKWLNGGKDESGIEQRLLGGISEKVVSVNPLHVSSLSLDGRKKLLLSFYQLREASQIDPGEDYIIDVYLRPLWPDASPEAIRGWFDSGQDESGIEKRLQDGVVTSSET